VVAVSLAGTDPRCGVMPRGDCCVPVIASSQPFPIAAAAGELAAQYRVAADTHLYWESDSRRRASEIEALAGELNQARHRLALQEQSRWTRLGRALGLGPGQD